MVLFWVPLYTRCRIILSPQKGTIILTTAHMIILCTPAVAEVQAMPPLGSAAAASAAYTQQARRSNPGTRGLTFNYQNHLSCQLSIISI